MLGKLTKEDYIKIAREYEIKGRRVLARELGVSEAWISQIVKRLRKEGVEIKLKTEEAKKRMAEAVAELKG